MPEECSTNAAFASIYAAVAERSLAPYVGMAEDKLTASYIRGWMTAVLEDNPGLSPASWARKAGVAASTVQRAIKADYPFVTSSRTLAKLAAAVGSEAPELPYRPRAVGWEPLPVRYKVQAGHWIENDDFGQLPDGPRYPVAPHPDFIDWPQWLEEVVGDSVDKLIPSGGFAHVVDAVAMGYSPTSGDLVVVERTRHGGHLHERSIKLVVTNQAGTHLVGVSTNPRWNGLVDLRAGAADGEEIEVRVVGRVIGAYRSFK